MLIHRLEYVDKVVTMSRKWSSHSNTLHLRICFQHVKDFIEDCISNSTKVAVDGCRGKIAIVHTKMSDNVTLEFLKPPRNVPWGKRSIIDDQIVARALLVFSWNVGCISFHHSPCRTALWRTCSYSHGRLFFGVRRIIFEFLPWAKDIKENQAEVATSDMQRKSAHFPSNSERVDSSFFGFATRRRRRDTSSIFYLLTSHSQKTDELTLLDHDDSGAYGPLHPTRHAHGSTGVGGGDDLHHNPKSSNR
mmetsp:Transcript_12122/g.29452  ORF Transcript_12122/g.29452 Transcript_12122/m.29452 type:complete len:248 (+) Transcript_12122:1158-1901(+)